MNLIDTVGPYAGILGFLGTAILAFLYFSQARDVRRLREWAGRGPERAAQTLAPNAASYTTDEDLLDEQTDEQLDEQTDEQLDEQLDEQTEEVALPPPPPPPPSPRSLEEVQQRRDEARRRWRWLSEPRYAALLIGGVLIFGAAAVAAVVVISDGGSSSSTSGSKSVSSPQQSAPVKPSHVVVAVLNGTGIPGLAQQVGTDLKSADFKVHTVTNASQQGLKRTSVLYTRGHKREAKAVAEQLRISSTRPADPQNASIGSGADVIVTVGSDRAPAGSSGSTGSTGAPATPAPTVPPTSGTPAPTGTPPPTQ